MNLVDRFFGTKEGGMLLSLIIGIAIPTLFRKKCIGDKCIIVKTDKTAIRDNIYKLDNGKCVKFTPKLKECSKN